MIFPRFQIVDLLRWLASRKPDECEAPDLDYTPPPQKLDEPMDPAWAHIWHDLRGEPRTKSRGEAKGSRKWRDVRGITLHQTAVDFGTNPRRLLNVPVHGATLRDGAIVLLHEPTAYMHHAGGFNSHDVGIEVSCRAAGIEGDERTLWRPKSQPDAKAVEATDEQLAATRELIRYYCNRVHDEGGEILYIHAHRQSSKNRVSDPGSRIWKACGEWAIRELGLSAGPPDFAVGDGFALPDAWTGRANGIPYNWRVRAILTEDDDNGDT